MPKALIGTYFKDKTKAIEFVERKNRMWRKNVFDILEFGDCFIVVSKKQITN